MCKYLFCLKSQKSDPYSNYNNKYGRTNVIYGDALPLNGIKEI